MRPRRSGPRARALAALLAAASSLGAKCIAFDNELAAQHGDAGGPAPGDGEAFACAQPHEAHLRVEEYAFVIECGCLEPPGFNDERLCTVPSGTTVRWTFAGSQKHNVISRTNVFPESTETAHGEHVVTLVEPGDYAYLCSLHPGDMSGYVLRVLPQAAP